MTVKLKISAPMWCTSYVYTSPAGVRLVLDRHGVDVPVEDAPDLVAAAARQGVDITEVSD